MVAVRRSPRLCTPKTQKFYDFFCNKLSPEARFWPFIFIIESHLDRLKLLLGASPGAGAGRRLHLQSAGRCDGIVSAIVLSSPIWLCPGPVITFLRQQPTDRQGRWGSGRGGGASSGSSGSSGGGIGRRNHGRYGGRPGHVPHEHNDV